jgi:hypothetical protein
MKNQKGKASKAERMEIAQLDTKKAREQKKKKKLITRAKQDGLE